MNEGLKRLNLRKNSLIEKINLAQRHKKSVSDKTKVLDAIYFSREITFKEYEQRIKKIFGARSPEKWLKYYDSYIKDCEKEIKSLDKELNKEKIKKIGFVVLPVFIILILFYSGIFKNNITGLSTRIEKETYTLNVGKVFTNNDNYNFEVEQGKLNWLKVYGEIEGEGEVRIFLDEVLVLDSSDLEFEKISLNGGVITGFSTEGVEQTITDSSSDDSSDSKSSSESPPTTSSDTAASPVIIGSSSDSQEQTQDDVAEPVTSPSSDDSNTGAAEKDTDEKTIQETPSAETTEIEKDKEKKQEEVISNETEKEEKQKTTSNETKKEDINESKEEIINKTKQENKSEEKENEPGAELKKKKFSDYCKDTCDLSAFNLNEGSYNLRVEIQGNAKLNLDKVKYEIEFEKEIIGGNLTFNETEENKTKIPEMNLTNATIPELNFTNFTIPPVLIKEIPDIEIEVNSSFNLTLSEHFFNAKEYEVDRADNIAFNLINETLEIVPDKAFIGNLTSKIFAKNSFGENESNEFNISVVETLKKVTTNVTTLQYKAIINKPVKWLKIVNANESIDKQGNIKIELPLEANNISVKTGNEIDIARQEFEDYDELVENANKETLLNGGITGNVALDLEEREGIITKILKWFKGLTQRGITGNVIQEEEIKEKITEEGDKKFVDVTEIVNETKTKDIAVEYYTEGPKAVEEEIKNGKRVVVSGNEELNFTDILAFAEIPERYNVGQEGKIKIYWRENRSFVNFSAHDLDVNGKIDYVEWLVPHLSNQTYDIILIIKAEHLDSNRTFISDIYDSVKALDGNWSETIFDGEYVRVTFEIPLDNTRDITVYAKAVNGSPVIEVYEVNDTRVIATFPVIENESYYKVYLNNLSECYDNQTEILTENGWKYFSELEKDEKVLTLNQTTGEKELQLPLDWQSFDFDGEMFKIVLDDGSEFVVSPEHRVYAGANDFELLPVKEVYSSFIEDNDIYFMNEEGEKVKIKSITKEDYNGKIYDVDVANDVILVRRWEKPEERESYYKSLNENKEKGSNRVAEPNRLIPNYDIDINTKYLNISDDEKENKEAFDVASKAMHNIFTDYVLNEKNNYINLSILDSNAENAPVASRVMQRSNKPRLHGHLGSSPGWGDSAFSTDNKIPQPPKAFWGGNSNNYSQDTFDLKVVNGDVEFEHIIDPQAQPGGVVELRAQTCVGEDDEFEACGGSFSGVCGGTYPAACASDLLSCNDGSSEMHTAATVASCGGVRGTYFNSTITNCASINQVFLCYEWWSNSADIGFCDIKVDANGGASPTDIVSTCPGTTANPGVTCVNVTANETWVCGNFFGSSGTRALIKSGFAKTGGVGTRTVSWDVLFFNVTYATTTFAPSATLNAPANASSITRQNTTLNATIIDNDGNNLNVYFYGVNASNTANFYKHGFLYKQSGVANNSKITYSWTAPVIVPDAGTVALYHLDNNSVYGETQTKAYDFVAGAFNLTAVANAFPNMTGGKFGGGWVFDGSLDHLSAGEQVKIIEGKGNVTFSAWIKRAGDSANNKTESIIKEGDHIGGGYWLVTDCFNDNNIAFGIDDGPTQSKAQVSQSAVTDGNWHHLAGVYSNSSNFVKLYVDGVLNSQSATGGIIPNGYTEGFTIGGYSSPTWSHPCGGDLTDPSFNGTIDEVAVWNRTLSDTEILDLYKLRGQQKYYWKVNVTDEDNNNNESVTWEFTLNDRVPSADLNAPANRSVFWIDVFNITLNTTVYDLDNEAMDVEIYGVKSNYSDATNFSTHGLLFQQKGVTNGTQITYNWTAPVNVYSYDIVSGGIVALWHLDNLSRFGENQTFVYDFVSVAQLSKLSANGNAFPNMTGGKFAGAWVFDGNGDYLQEIGTSGAANGIDTVTFSAWVKRAGNSATGYETIVQENVASTGYSLTASCNDGFLGFSGRTANGESVAVASSSRSIIEDGQWHLVTGVKSSDAISLYVDGVLKSSTSGVLDVGDGSKAITIGGHSSDSGTSCDGSTTSSGSFNGSIDEVVIWNRDLSAAEVKNLYRLQKGKYFWKVNVTDSEGNNIENGTREFFVKDTSYVYVNGNWNCTQLLTEVTDYQYGYSCTAAGYSTCVGLNSDLNISGNGAVLNVPGSCNIIFNTSSNGQYNFIVENSGKLNLTGGNITTVNVSNKFNFKPYLNFPVITRSSGNLSFFNVSNNFNITDSRINFYNLTISSGMIILNSSDIALGTYNASAGRLDRQWRLNVSVYSAGSTISGANVTLRNVSSTIIDSKLTGSDGKADFNLSEYYDIGSGKINQNNYTINVTKAGYFQNQTSFNLTSDSNTGLNIRLFDTIEVSSTETPHDIFTRIGNSQVFNNLSSGARPCRYVSTASINVTANGNLVLESCTLEMNNTDAAGGSGIYDLIVGGGRLTANYSNITRSENYNYDFYTDSGAATQFILKNSFVSFAGSGTTNNLRGLSLNTNNVTFSNNTIINGYAANIEIGANLIYLQQSKFLGASQTPSYNIFVRANDSLILDSNISNAVSEDLRFIAGSNLTLLNTNHSDESTLGANASLFKQWYTDVRVVDTGGTGINNSNVSFYNVSGTLTHNILTNSSGDIVRQNVTEYISNGTVRNFWTNYTINVTASGFNAGSQSLNLTTSTNLTFVLTSSNSAPTITQVYANSNITPTEATTVNVNVNFTVTDTDGGGTINISTAQINFTRSGEPLRANNSCSLLATENSTNTRNFTCTIGMWYFDFPGTWNITAYVEDNSQASAQNTTTTFNYDTLQAFVISPNVMTWSLPNMTAVNTSASNNPMTLNNTGNYNSSVKLYSVNLYGESFASQFIPVGNISVDNSTGGCGGNALVNGTNVTISNAILPRGNNSLNVNNETSGQEQISFCLRSLPTGLSSQVFSTGNNPWIIYIFTAVFGIAGSEISKIRRRKKKNKLLNKKENNDLSELDSENILDIFDKKLRERYDLGLNELLDIAKKRTLRKETQKEIKKEVKIPLEVFRQKIGAAESICKYLKENEGLKYNQISRIVGRDQRTIWNNYRNAVRKMEEEIKVDENTKYIPIKVFSNRKLSMLESVIYYLKEERYRNKEIASMLGKDARNIWTIWNRARKKVLNDNYKYE